MAVLVRNPFRREREQKALHASPGVLEAASVGQFQPYITLGGTNLDTRAINSVFIQGQTASYGYLYSYQPAVRSVIDYIARNIAQLELAIYRDVTGSGKKRETDHPAATSLENPNPWTPGQKLIFNLVADFLVYDNSYVLKLRSGSPTSPVTLVNVPPSAVGIIGQARFQAEGYRFYRADGTFFDVTPESVIHWRGYNPENPKQGFSKLETLRQELAADATARQTKTELDKAGLLPRGWVERPLEASELKEEKLDRLREQLSNWGKQSTRKIPILEDGMTFRQATVSPEDAQLLDARQFTKGEVNAAYGLQNVPPQSPDERRQVYADVLAPICEELCSFLDLSLIKEEFGADDLHSAFNLDEKLRGEPLDRWAAETSTTGTPWRTVNEVRALEGLPPVPDGDKLVTPANTVAGGGNGKPLLPAPNVMPIQDANKPPQDGSYRQNQGPTPLPSGNAGKTKRFDPNEARDERGRWMADVGNPDLPREVPSFGKYKSLIADMPIPGDVLLHRPSGTRVQRNGEKEFKVSTGIAHALHQRWKYGEMYASSAEEAAVYAIGFVSRYNLIMHGAPATTDWGAVADRVLRGGGKALEDAETKRFHISTQPARIGDIARQRRNIDKATALFVHHFNRQAKSFGLQAKKAENWDRWSRELTAEIKRFLQTVFEIEGGIYVGRLGGSEFDMGQRAHWIDATAEGIADAVTIATKQDIQKQGQEAALSQARGGRAKTLGRSLGARSTINARYEAAVQAPNPESRQKVWIADTERHRKFDGVGVALDGSWDGIEPGSEPGCACSIQIR